MAHYFSKDNDDSLAMLEEMHRKAIFFVENRKTNRWVIPASLHGTPSDAFGDDTSINPHHAQRFESKFQAMTFMVENRLKYTDWSITEHEFVN